jgi:hypothetical protein
VMLRNQDMTNQLDLRPKEEKFDDLSCIQIKVKDVPGRRGGTS